MSALISRLFVVIHPFEQAVIKLPMISTLGMILHGIYLEIRFYKSAYIYTSQKYLKCLITNMVHNYIYRLL